MIRSRLFRGCAELLCASLVAGPAWAQPSAARIDTGDTCWVLLCTVLVLLMTVPGLALFYGGMVRKKNILATMMQSFSICALVTVIWIMFGYSLAYTNGNGWIGDGSRFFLNGLVEHWNEPFVLGAGSTTPVPTTIPESVFMMFEMAFAIITPAVVTGAFADRMKFSALLVFMGLWSLVVYAPITHWVWSATGFLSRMGVADFAGGTVVEINAGTAGL
ncbi:MAG: ammonium transporter, partial [Alphaproteobacteria bacterium]|nr:ammonium transporter [Alphaproteobacteria bacterium]